MRAVWNVADESLEASKNLISSFRLDIDDRIQKIHGVHFLISCITGTKTNRKSSNGENATVRPAISYFVCFTPSSSCGSNQIFDVLHDSGLHPEISTIKVKGAGSEEDQLLKMLCSCFKDHNNTFVKDMVSKSNRYCLSTACAALLYENQPTVAAQLTEEMLNKAYARGNLCPVP